MGCSCNKDENICILLQQRAADRRKWANQTQTNNKTGMRGRAGPLCLQTSLSLTTKTSTGHTFKHIWSYGLNRNYTHTHINTQTWLRDLKKGWGCAGSKRVTEIWGWKKTQKLGQAHSSTSCTFFQSPVRHLLVFSPSQLPYFIPCVHHWLLSFPSSSRNC